MGDGMRRRSEGFMDNRAIKDYLRHEGCVLLPVSFSVPFIPLPRIHEEGFVVMHVILGGSQSHWMNQKVDLLVL